MTMSRATCEVCGGPQSRVLDVREMMFGLREHFRYGQCASCGALQITDIPADIARFYPADYYSYQLHVHSASRRKRRGRRRNRILTWPAAVLPLLRMMSSADTMFHVYREIGVTPQSRIVDVGGGSGTHALDMRDAGLSDAFAIDPFVPADVVFEGKTLVRKISIHDLTGEYDVVAFHHSLEHMEHQIGVLSAARRRLAPGGQVLVRIPTVSSEAFETYQENWVNLDAPRHFFLHSHKSLVLAAEKAGLRQTRLWCDSGGMSFMGSEQYRRDMPLMDPHSAAKTKAGGLFTATQRREFEAHAARLNRELRGDLLCATFSAA